MTELNPATRAPIVIKNGKPELGDLCTLPLFGDNYKFVVNRVPVRDNQGDVIGMVSHILFTDPNELKELHDKIDLLQKKKKIYNKSNNSSCTRYNVDSIVGESRKIVEIKRQIKIYAADSHPVLIRGNTGTGKELVAQALHSGSTYASGKFVSINCAAVPTELFEAELFGYAPGAFSGAHKSGKMGLLELANGGTLFLDEIGDIPLHAQVKLLRALEEQEILRVGAVSPVKVDFRLITATNRDLNAMVGEGTFREDLYYRINALRIYMPPLCERGDDILLLARHILSKIGYLDIDFTEKAARAMSGSCSMHWYMLPYIARIRLLILKTYQMNSSAKTSSRTALLPSPRTVVAFRTIWSPKRLTIFFPFYRRIMGTSPRQHRSWASPALLCMENSSGTESGEVLLAVHEWRNV